MTFHPLRRSRQSIDVDIASDKRSFAARDDAIEWVSYGRIGSTGETISLEEDHGPWPGHLRRAAGAERALNHLLWGRSRFSTD